MLERFERLAAMSGEELGRLARIIQPRSVGAQLDVDGTFNFERGGNTSEKINDWCGCV
jgi:hypothetical protein